MKWFRRIVLASLGVISLLLAIGMLLPSGSSWTAWSAPTSRAG